MTTEQLCTNLELWKPVVGYEGCYEVSNIGRVRRLSGILYKKNRFNPKGFKWKGRILRPISDKRGYFHVDLSMNNIRKKHSVHQLVARAFIPNPLNREIINHINAKPGDNRVENLEWSTPKENKIHAVMMGLASDQKGEKNNSSILKNKQVIEIKTIFKEKGRVNFSELGRKYKVNSQTISDIYNGRRWGWLTI